MHGEYDELNLREGTNMKFIAIVLLYLNFNGAFLVSELVKKNGPDLNSEFATNKRMARTIQKLPGTIYGKENPEMIPNHVAYEFLLRAIGTRPSRDVITADNERISKTKVREDRLVALIDQAEIDIWQMRNLMAAGESFTRQVKTLDIQVTEIKRANWPDPTPEVMDGLRALQQQKETLITEAMDELYKFTGEDNAEKLRRYATEEIKRNITGIPVPHPRKAHELFHGVKGQLFKSLVQLAAVRSTPMQVMGTAYVYTNRYESGDYAVGFCSATGDSYSSVHEYIATTSITSPDNRYAETSSGYNTPYVETATYIPLRVGDILIDGHYSIFSRVEVLCSIALIGYVIHEIVEDLFVPQGPIIDRIEGTRFLPRGLIGSQVEVSVVGHNFGANPRLQVGGSGISVSVQVRTDTDILTTFTISNNDQALGNHAVTVRAGTRTSSAKNFFVYKPDRVTLEQQSNVIVIDPGPGDVEAPDGTAIETNRCGAYRRLTYRVVDQSGGLLEDEGVVTETVCNSAQSGCPVVNTRSINTDEQGRFGDVVGFTRGHPMCPQNG